jgi:hypothetical protein
VNGVQTKITAAIHNAGGGLVQRGSSQVVDGKGG